MKSIVLFHSLANQRHKKTKRSHSAAENLYANSTITVNSGSHKQHQKSSLKFTNTATNYPDEMESEASKRKRRKKLVHQFSTPNGGNSPEAPDSPKPVVKTRLSSTAGLLFYAGKGFLSGLTGMLMVTDYGISSIKRRPPIT